MVFLFRTTNKISCLAIYVNRHVQKITAYRYVRSQIFSICQSMGVSPCETKNSLHILKWLHPQKPLYTDNGLG